MNYIIWDTKIYMILNLRMKSNMKHFYVFIVCAVLMLGCTVENDVSVAPPYVVMLTNGTVVNNKRCGGVAIDAFHVLSAMHCNKLQGPRRVVTKYLQEANLIEIQMDLYSDLVLYKTSAPLYISEYAQFAEPSKSAVSAMYGMCTYYPSFVARFFSLVHRGMPVMTGDNVMRSLDTWSSVLHKACMSDSGGAVIQGGKVVGIVHGVVYDNLVLNPIGNVMFTIGYGHITSFLSQALKEN